MLHWMDDPEVGRVCLPSSPLRFTDARADARAISVAAQMKGK
jgi:hypothetical protein